MVTYFEEFHQSFVNHSTDNMDPKTEYENLKNIAANHYNTINTINKQEDIKSMQDIIKKQRSINRLLVKIIKSLNTVTVAEIHPTPVEDGQTS